MVWCILEEFNARFAIKGWIVFDRESKEQMGRLSIYQTQGVEEKEKIIRYWADFTGKRTFTRSLIPKPGYSISKTTFLRPRSALCYAADIHLRSNRKMGSGHTATYEDSP